jgi:hypothetical protein
MHRNVAPVSCRLSGWRPALTSGVEQTAPSDKARGASRHEALWNASESRQLALETHAHCAANRMCPKSLFRKILRVKYLESGFCGWHFLSNTGKSQKTDMLGLNGGKFASPMQRAIVIANSLLWRILHVSYLESIFCSKKSTCLPANHRNEVICNDDLEKFEARLGDRFVLKLPQSDDQQQDVEEAQRDQDRRSR